MLGCSNKNLPSLSNLKEQEFISHSCLEGRSGGVSAFPGHLDSQAKSISTYSSSIVIQQEEW